MLLWYFSGTCPMLLDLAPRLESSRAAFVRTRKGKAQYDMVRKSLRRIELFFASLGLALVGLALLLVLVLFKGRLEFLVAVRTVLAGVRLAAFTALVGLFG